MLVVRNSSPLFSVLMLVSVPSMISLVYSFDVVSYEKYENPIKILVFSLFIIKSSTLTIYIYIPYSLQISRRINFRAGVRENLFERKLGHFRVREN